MKIDSLKINHFGNLKETEIKLGPNINIIYGSNESGKSTLLKFIVGMFYGISKNKNGKWISDLERYTPWEEGDFSGKIQYHLESGESFEVFREFKKKNPKIYDSHLVDITKNFPVDKTKGNLFFLNQTGMEEELFCSTIVSEQASVKLEEKNRQSVIQKVANLMGTGQDYTSFEKVMAKLNKRQLEEVGSEKSQERPMNKTKRRMDQLRKKIEELETYHHTQYEIQERKETLKKLIQEKENKVNALKEIKKLKEKQEKENEKITLKEEDRKEYAQKKEQLEKRKQEIIDQNIIVSKPSYLAVVVGIVIGLILFLVGMVVENIIVEIGGGILLLASAGYGFLSKQNMDKTRKQIQQEKDKNIEILEQQIKMIKENIVQKEEGIYLLKQEICKQVEQETSRIRNKYMHNVEHIEELLQKENITYELEYLQSTLNGKKLELQSLELEEKKVLPELETLSSMKEELEREVETYQYLQEHAECISLAKQTIEEAYSQMKQEITPRFTQNLSETMRYISKGKYQKVKLNEQNEIMVETQNGNYVSAETLSIGTIDQIYLSLRLAIAQDLAKEEMPILLDEAFAYFDEERLGNVLEFLYHRLEHRQVLIFTCTKREQKILEERNMDYHMIEMEKTKKKNK